MHTVKIEISEQAFDRVMYLLKNLPEQDVRVISKKSANRKKSFDSDVTAFANHSANLVDDWNNASEDEIWT